MTPDVCLDSAGIKRKWKTSLYLVTASARVSKSYTSAHSTVQNPCPQRSRISLTPIRTIYFTVCYESMWTSGCRQVDCYVYPLPAYLPTPGADPGHQVGGVID